MARNGIYTRGMVSRSGSVYKLHLEIYDRKKAAVTEEDAEMKGDYTPEEIQDRIKRTLGPGRALISCETVSTKPAVFEMDRDKFFQTANCREV